MANWSNLKASISDVIKTNGNQEITGQILQNVLNNIVSNLGANATFAGIATPFTNPGAPDGPIFYLTAQAGIYNNFGGVEIEAGIAVLLWNGSNWTKNQVLTISQELGDGENAVMSQKAVTDELNALGATVWPLSVSFSASSSLIEYTGQAKEVTLNWIVKRKDASITVTSLTVKQDSSSIYSGTANPGSQKVNVNTKGVIKYDLSASADGLTVTSSTTINIVLPMYFGFNVAADTGSLNITTLSNSAVKINPSGTYTLTNNTDGKYIWLCIPDTMTINRVTLNGFDVPMEVAQNSSTNLGGYKCYRSSNALVAGSYTIIIS